MPLALLPTVTAVSTVTVVPLAMVAVSPFPGGPEPPHVEVLDQLPEVVDV